MGLRANDPYGLKYDRNTELVTLTAEAAHHYEASTHHKAGEHSFGHAASGSAQQQPAAVSYNAGGGMNFGVSGSNMRKSSVHIPQADAARTVAQQGGGMNRPASPKQAAHSQQEYSMSLRERCDNFP